MLAVENAVERGKIGGNDFKKKSSEISVVEMYIFFKKGWHFGSPPWAALLLGTPLDIPQASTLDSRHLSPCCAYQAPNPTTVS